MLPNLSAALLAAAPPRALFFALVFALALPACYFYFCDTLAVETQSDDRPKLRKSPFVAVVTSEDEHGWLAAAADGFPIRTSDSDDLAFLSNDEK